MKKPYLLTNEENKQFGVGLQTLLKNAKHVRIASGYIGRSAFLSIRPRLCEIMKSGGHVSIILGLAFWEGISQQLEDDLRSFDDGCRSVDEDTGVNVCIYNRYHGKIYLVEKPGRSSVASVGSSNLSATGFGGWHEGNLVTFDSAQVALLSDYFGRMIASNALPISGVDCLVRRKESRSQVIETHQANKQMRTYALPPDLGKLPRAFDIPLHVTEKSNFNQFLTARVGNRVHPDDKGPGTPKEQKRKIRTAKYRPWHEMELTLRKDDIKPELLNCLPNQKEPYMFKLVTEDGLEVDALFKRKTSGKSSPKTLHETTLDFMTTPRSWLGHILKGKLEEAGLLRFGEPVTEETLEAYGTDRLVFRKLGANRYLMTF